MSPQVIKESAGPLSRLGGYVSKDYVSGQGFSYSAQILTSHFL